MTPKRKKLLWFLLALNLTGAMGLLCVFGPPGIKMGDDRVLSSVKLPTGSKLFVVARRTGYVSDVYEVSLYRSEPGGRVFIFTLAHEEPYWWGCSMHPVGEDKIQILGFWSLKATYSARTDSVSIREQGERGFTLQFIDGQELARTVPKGIMQTATIDGLSN